MLLVTEASGGLVGGLEEEHPRRWQFGRDERTPANLLGSFGQFGRDFELLQ